MKKSIALTIALLVLPVNFAFAAPAGEYRAQLEEAQAQKRLEMAAILQEAELMKDALHQHDCTRLPVASLKIKSPQPAADRDASI